LSADHDPGCYFGACSGDDLLAAAIRKFADNWQRKPGRPQKVSGAD